MATDEDRSWVGSMPEIYDRCLGRAVFHPFAVDLARRAAPLRPHAVLEVAAGTGIATRELVAALPDATVTATDLNGAMVAWGDRAVPQAQWAAADAQRLPFADGRFDLVASQFGVMFFPNRPAAFAQARRVLAPGGRLLFTTWDAVERVVADVRAGGFAEVEVDTVTRTGHARSAADIAVGFCTGSPLRAGIESRGDLRTATALVEEVVTAELGTGPVTAEMTAHVVEARS